MDRLLVVVVAHNRPYALRQLLCSLAAVHVPTEVGVDVVVSIDGPPREEMLTAAQSISRGQFNDLRIVQHPHNLGLRDHVLSCGRLIEDYDALVMLEDDLLVAKPALTAAVAMLRAYGQAPLVSQVALYAPGVNQAASLPFLPLDDGHDVYLARVPCSWGQAWSREQWARFEDALDVDATNPLDRVALPEAIERWPEDTSWKKSLYRHMVSAGTYVVYPQAALTTNTGAAGTHFNKDVTALHVPLVFGDRLSNGSLPDVADMLRYDEFGEIEYGALRRLNPNLPADSVVVDLTACRPLPDAPDALIVTTRPVYERQAGFSGDLLPVEANVAFGLAGEEISLARRRTVAESGEADPWLATFRAPTRFGASQLNPPDRWLRHLPLSKIARSLLRMVAWRLRNRSRQAVQRCRDAKKART